MNDLHLHIRHQAERFTLHLTITPLGSDLQVMLIGGDKPHIGAVALAVPHPGLKDPKRIDATVSVLAMTGHKEDELARIFARTLACALNVTVCATCGIHLHQATHKDIEDILCATDELLREAVGRLCPDRPQNL